jgi:magnesium-transporting ATPase (P-type)
MQPGSKRYFTQWMLDVWRNQFLFWAIIVGFVLLFPLIYIPVLNTVVFKHAPIDWEWGIVFVETGIFFAGIEFWKWCKRVYFRRKAAKQGAGKLDKNMEIEDRVFGRYYTHDSSTTGTESIQEKA